MYDRSCILCRVYFPDSEPLPPRRPPVCDGDRLRLARDLADVADYHYRLVNPEPIERNDRTYAVRDIKGRLTGDLRRADPVAGIGGAGPVPARSTQPRVSGSRDPAVPVDLDLLDLTAPARNGAVRDTLVPAVAVIPAKVISRRVVTVDGVPAVREESVPVRRQVPLRDRSGRQLEKPAGDQIGHLSAATVLYQWVDNWQELLWPDHHLPPATVDELAGWLWDRVDDACTHHPAIVDCATEIRRLCATLHSACGDSEAPPDVLLGVRCRYCRKVSQMVRMPGDPYVECRGCGLLLTKNEFEAWMRELAAEAAAPGS